MRGIGSIRTLSAAKNDKFRSKIYRVLAKIGASIGIFCTPIVFFDTIGYPASVVGTSMEPTLEGNDRRWWRRDIVWLTRFGIKTPQIGQIFTFISPQDPDKQHIKRVTALEGDTIRPRKGPAFVCIPEGCCWMESDNPKNSKDSNIYGPVCRGLLRARATHIIWPPSRWQSIETYLPQQSSQIVRNDEIFFSSLFEPFEDIFSDSPGL